MSMVRYAWLAVVLVTFPVVGCASSTPSSGVTAGSSTPADVAGNWRGFFGQGTFSSEIVYELQQDGAKVTGRANPIAAGGGWINLEGTVTGDTFSYGLVGRTCCAELTVRGDEMTGRTTGGAPVQLRRVK